MINYQDAGVDISKGNEAVKRIKKHVAITHNNNVLTQLGGFCSGFSLKEICQKYDSPILVQSMDGVGTKMIVARMANDFSGIGHDLLSACVNDILVMGATPLTILDYLASDSLDITIIENIIESLSIACATHNVALVGGEMAQMPDTYRDHEWDIVGIVTGIIDQSKMITGDKIQTGDIVVSFSSNGLHTNGYSLARKLLFEVAKLDIHSHIESLNTTVAQALLAPHINYTKPILDLLHHHVDIHGMAHITGGGIWDNIPRILPEKLSVDIHHNTWPIPKIFNYLMTLGNIDQFNAYHTFNMGIGFVMILPESAWKEAKAILNNHSNFQVNQIGKVVEGQYKVRLIS